MTGILAEVGRITGPITEISGKIVFGLQDRERKAGWPEADEIRRIGQSDDGPERR